MNRQNKLSSSWKLFLELQPVRFPSNLPSLNPSNYPSLSLQVTSNNSHSHCSVLSFSFELCDGFFRSFLVSQGPPEFQPCPSRCCWLLLGWGESKVGTPRVSWQSLVMSQTSVRRNLSPWGQSGMAEAVQRGCVSILGAFQHQAGENPKKPHIWGLTSELILLWADRWLPVIPF